MKRPRFSIASILAVIAILAVALAALRSPSYLWANVTSSLALAALVVALINVIYGRGAGRAYWIGFSLCGGIYFTVSTAPGLRDAICPRLVTEVALDLLYPHVSPPSATPGFSWTVAFMPGVPNGTAASPYPSLPAPPGPAPGNYSVVYSSPMPSTGGPSQVVAQIPVSQWAAWTEPDRTVGVGYMIGTVPLCSSEAYRRIGHAMFALLFGVLGGAYARHRYRRSVAHFTAARTLRTRFF